MWLRIRTGAGSCKHGKKKCREFIEQLSNYQLLKTGSTPFRHMLIKEVHIHFIWALLEPG
jgi:hypothetical protein